MLQGINILVAEDNLLNQKIVNFILQKQHATVSNAINGREAINLLGQGEFDIILMDLQMPEMDGCEAAKYIRANISTGLPIVAVTASISAAEQNDALNCGMNAYISKPFDPDELCIVISKLVKERKIHVTE